MSEDPTPFDWSDLDGGLKRAKEYLDTTSGLAAIREYKRRSHHLLDLSPNDRVVDVGCGAGIDVELLAETLDPDAAVIGIDRSAPLVAAAREETATHPNVNFGIADAMTLPLADSSVDACRADRVLEHLETPGDALEEMIRITKPGGRIGLSEPDWGTVRIAAPGSDRSVTRHVTRPSIGSPRHPHIGSRLYPLLGSHGLVDRAVDAITVVFTEFDTANDVLSLDDRLTTLQQANDLPDDQAKEWTEAMQGADAAGTFFASITGFTVVGQVPTE